MNNPKKDFTQARISSQTGSSLPMPVWRYPKDLLSTLAKVAE